MLIFFYIIKHIITHKNKILYKFFYVLFAPYNLKGEKRFVSVSDPYSNFYINYLRIYMINLRFNFYESLQDQC